MKRAVMLSLTMMLCACASPQPENVASSNLKRDMDKWVGRPVDELVAAKGAPTEAYLLEAGGRLYEYVRKTAGGGVPSSAESDAGALSGTGIGYQTAGGNIVIPAGAGSIVIPSATGGVAEPVRSRNKTQARKMPCELQFIISASNVIEGWATEGDCN